LYFNPSAASLSKTGVGIGPPKVLVAPKPTSSTRMSTTLGAPAGDLGGLGQKGCGALPLDGTVSAGDEFGFAVSLLWAKAGDQELNAIDPLRKSPICCVRFIQHSPLFLEQCGGPIPGEFASRSAACRELTKPMPDSY
jgi:hypothetical protein